MKRLMIFFLMFSVSSAWSAIPNPHIYEWGKLEVPENYSFSSSQKLQIYWEKLKSTSSAPDAIIMINGGPGMTHDSFHQPNSDGSYNRDYASPLRTNFDIYYFDQRGTGQSSALSYENLISRDMRQYASADICRDIEELRKNVIKKEKIAVFGESYGGMVALTYAIMFPDRVSKLVIHDSSPSNNYFTHMHKNFSEMLSVLDQKLPGVRENLLKCVEMFDAGQVVNAYGIDIPGRSFLSIILNLTYSFRGQIIIAMMAQQIVIEGQSEIFDRLLGGIVGRFDSNRDEAFKNLPVTLTLIQSFEMLDEAEIAKAQAGPAYAPWDFTWMNNILQMRRDFKYHVRLDSFKAYNVISQLGKIRAPTLVMVGETDFVCPPAYAEIIKNGIGKHCRMIKIPNAAHSGFIEQHEFTVGKIRDFLIGHWPGYDYRIRQVEDFSQTHVSSEEVLTIWLEGARRLGLTAY